MSDNIMKGMVPMIGVVMIAGVLQTLLAKPVEPVAALSSIAITPIDIMAIGFTQQLTAIGTYSDGSVVDVSSQVTWTSLYTSVATVSSTGLATSITNGSTSITASMSGKTSPAVILMVQPAGFGCPYCNLFFDTIGELIAHINTAHPGEPNFQEVDIGWS